jgi:hypothetical protein
MHFIKPLFEEVVEKLSTRGHMCEISEDEVPLGIGLRVDAENYLGFRIASLDSLLVTIAGQPSIGAQNAFARFGWRGEADLTNEHSIQHAVLTFVKEVLPKE